MSRAFCEIFHIKKRRNKAENEQVYADSRAGIQETKSLYI
jgi:hypothetical protein